MRANHHGLCLASAQHGAKVVVVDRMTSIGRTADLFLPVRPGRDIVMFNGVLRQMIHNDWLDHDFIQQHTVGFEDVAKEVEQWTLEATARETGIKAARIEQAAEWWGTPAVVSLHARGIEHHTHGVQNCLGAINMVLVVVSVARAAARHHYRSGQWPGGREHGQKCDQLPAGRDISNPGIAPTWLRSGVLSPTPYQVRVSIVMK